MISSLFYLDVLDRPELIPILDEAVNLAVSFGPWVIPVLVDNLDAGDLKAQWAIAHVLGRIGAEAIQPMMKEYASAADPTLRAFILYSLGKIKSPKIMQAVALVLEAMQSSEREVRDTATRTLGKLVESIPPAHLSQAMKKQFLDRLNANLSDTNASVRAKAVRSLGKLAKYGHLADLERAQLKSTCSRILGIDEKGEWDRAYVVRREAEEAIGYL